MRRLVLMIMALLTGVAALAAAPAGRTISGRVYDASSEEPLCGVVLSLGEDYLWAVTGVDGDFTIENIQKGDYVLKASCLGYVDVEMELDIKEDIDDLQILMKVSSLSIKEVVVTAQKPKDGLSTTHTLGRDALNHLQMSNMSDMTALLPGGKTVNPDLTSSNSLSLRAGGSNAGNAAFGTALEVDGVRLGNNAGFGEMAGMDTRSVAVDNIESIEVVTGVPSAEYGDLNSGMVKINTKKGRTPYNITFSVNPRTYQTSASKGFDLGGDRGVINASVEWARATKKLDSPYQSYTRRGATVNYSNTFLKHLRLEAGMSANIGGMNSKDDPDAFSGEFEKVRDNTFRANGSLTWMLNLPWVTNLKFDASLNFQDNKAQTHKLNSYSANQPSVHATDEGYFLADRLPLTFYSDQIIDSKELDLAASAKYEWTKRWGDMKSQLKAGLQWKANGNAGAGEYYEDASLAANGYRPRPYSDYPFMHNLSLYAEEHFSMPLLEGKLDVTGGLRLETVMIRGSQYKDKATLSPRFNAKWEINRIVSVRFGWGITEKLPSFYILYPKQEYWDKQTYSFSHGESSSYVYYTRPFTIEYNEHLRWQRNQNFELGTDVDIAGFKISAVGFLNITRHPYKFSNIYTPFTYSLLQTPSDFAMPDDPQMKVDYRTGEVFLRASDEEFWTAMQTKTVDRTFVKTTRQDNGADMYRAGAELTVDFPEIKPIRTSFRLDANYTYTKYNDEGLTWYYQSSLSHTSIRNRSYEYLGIYANGGNNNSVINGKITHNMDANITSITHIPEVRLIITCRLEMALLNRSLNLSTYNGGDYAFTTTQDSRLTTGGDIHAGASYSAVWPIAVVGVDDNEIHYVDRETGNITFGEDVRNINDPEFQNLILRSSNKYTFAQDGYGFYCSANLSITKEIGDHVSLSFFANNFTNSRAFVISKATGVGRIMTPQFYYGLTCRVKF